MEPSDEQIISEFAAGRKEAVKVIYARYKLRMLNFCWRMLGNRGEAEDASCEVFLSLLTTTYTPQANAKFSTWLYTIARNQCVNILRQKSRYIREDEVGDLAGLRLSDEEPIAAEVKETGDYVRQALSRLSNEQREAIVLQHYENLSYEQIALVLNCSLDKVKVLIFRAKEKLRIELAFLIKEGGR